MDTQVIKLNFTGEKIYTGIDVHKNNWMLTIETNDLVLRTFSQPPEPVILQKYLRKHFPGADYLCGYEAGFCGFWIQKELEAMGIKCVVVHAADIPTTDKEKVYKRDPIDSRKIARMLRTGDYEALYIPGQNNLGDRALVRARRTLVQDLSRYKHRIKGMLNFWGIRYPEPFIRNKTHWSNRFITWLKEIDLHNPSARITLDMMIDQVNQLRKAQLDMTQKIRILSRDSNYKQSVDFLLSVPGIGLIAAMTLLTEIENIRRFHNLDHFCSFAGLIPTSHSTGDKDVTGSITKRGNRILKTILIESAWVTLRSDPAMLMAFRKLCVRMDRNKAIIRIARKLASRILFVLKNQQSYKYLLVH